MTKHDYKQSAYYLLYLIRCVLNHKIPSKDKLDKMDLSQLYTVAKAHSLTAITAYALESVGIIDEQFKQEKYKAIRKNLTMDIERQRVTAELEKAGIWYMPLKGVVLQDYYPMIGMRQMCDNDILFDKTQVAIIKPIMISLGFGMKHDDSGHDLAFIKKPVCNFEMHTDLFGIAHDEIMNQYYVDVRKRLLKDTNNKYGFHFTNEDFYIFMTAHEYKHFSKSGTGLRSLVDTYVYLNHFSGKLDMEYIRNELSKLGIADFEQHRRKLAMDLFCGKRLNTDEKKLLDYYIFSGTYGTIENSVNNSINGSLSSRVKYLVGRLFLTLPQIKASYPFFYKHKFLIPLLFLYRIGLMLTKSRKRMMSEVKTLIRI